MSHEPSVFGGPPVARAVDEAQVGPLSEQDYLVLRQALLARVPIQKAARIARKSAISILVVGVTSIPLAAFSMSASGLMVVAAICIIGYLEYVGCRRMKAAEPAAASHLGWNQVVFIVLIALYCIDQMLSASNGGGVSDDARAKLSRVPELARTVETILPAATFLVYGLVMVVSLLVQGTLAWYYFSRRKYLDMLQRTTPAWVQRLFRELGV